MLTCRSFQLIQVIKFGHQHEITFFRFQDEFLGVFLYHPQSSQFLVISHLEQEDIDISHGFERVADFLGGAVED